jgi:hypothetical protein
MRLPAVVFSRSGLCFLPLLGFLRAYLVWFGCSAPDLDMVVGCTPLSAPLDCSSPERFHPDGHTFVATHPRRSNQDPLLIISTNSLS